MTLGTFARGYPANHEKSERRPELGAPPLHNVKCSSRDYYLDGTLIKTRVVIVISISDTDVPLQCDYRMNARWYLQMRHDDAQRTGMCSSC